jgi:hypothetical protein
MSKVIADITMSLDGYVTGPLADSQHGLGDIDKLHTWVAEQDPIDTEILEQIAATTVPWSWVGGCSISSTGPMAGPRT